MNHTAALATNNSKDPWALLGDGSIDFSALDEDLADKSCSLMNDCSHADTISTAGESSSWGSSFDCDYNLGAAAAAASVLQCSKNEEDDNASEGSLTMEDIKSFMVEDQVGVFNPTRDDIPPPKARTEYKGDSQNSFTLEDLEADLFEEADNDAQDKDSLGCLPTPTGRRQSAARRRRSSSRRNLSGILKNGQCNTRRSSSLTMLMMEDSSLFQMSLGMEDSSTAAEEDEWALMNESFDVEAALDLQVLHEKQVRFSSIVVHEHAVVVGDNPSVSEGAPLMLSWKAEESTTFESIDDYEEQRKQPPTLVRKLDSEERMWRLMNAGATLEEIQEAEALANKVRQGREATRQSHFLGGPRAVFWKAIQRSDENGITLKGRRRKSPPK